jgi:cytochrome c
VTQTEPLAVVKTASGLIAGIAKLLAQISSFVFWRKNHSTINRGKHMKVNMWGLLALAIAALSRPSYANQELATNNACLACHAVDKKIVGPSFKEVAQKYAGDPAAEATLIEKVKKGGDGVWGSMPMPPNPSIKNQDLKTLVQWILSFK